MAPIVDVDKCEGCGNCMEVCPADVFVMEDDKAKVENPDNCLDCGACAEECPPQAITIDE